MKNIYITICLIIFSLFVYADTYHSGDINSNETWNASDSPHIITTHIEVLNGVTLTIEPGSIVKFGGNLQLIISGTLVANGTTGSHIVFEADETVLGDGHWMNILFTVSDGINILNYCDISKGGSASGNIVVSGGSDLTISNCNIQNSASNGIELKSISSPTISNTVISNNLNNGIELTDCEPLISNCSLSSNGQYGVFANDSYGYLTVSGGSIHNNNGPAMRVPASDVKNITGVSILGNSPNKIEVLGEQIGDATWDQEVAFVILSDITVQNSSILTLAPGTVCQFNANAGLNIYGALDANASELLPIVFTSSQAVPAPGDWKFIYFQSYDISTLNFCYIYNGGSSNGNVYVRSGNNITISNSVIQYSGSNGIYLYENASPSIDNTIISNNDNFGVYSNSNNCYPGISGGTISDNGGPAMRVSPGAAHWIDNVLMYDNTPDEIQILGGNFYTDALLDDPYPYKILGNLTVNYGVTLTLSPGVVCKFNGDYRLWISGALLANGTSLNHITFTSYQETPTNGFWQNIYFNTNNTNVLTYCDIFYGGSSYGALYLNNTDDVNISNCNIQHSGNDGIFLYQSSPHILDNLISENDNHGVHASSNCYPALLNNQIINNQVNGVMSQGLSNPSFGSNISEWNDIYGNANYDLYNNTSNDMDAQYVYWGTTDPVQIASAIYDQNDNGAKGVVNFNPWTNAVHDELYPSAGFDVNLKVYLEGPFNGADMNTNLNPNHIPLAQPFNVAPWNYPGSEAVVSIPNVDIVDWILVELRDAADAASATSGTVIAQQAAFLNDDGTIVGTDGTVLPNFDVSVSDQLFVVIWHRNHLGIMSANSLSEAGGIYTYDFTTSAAQAYGTNSQKDIGSGVFGMISADSNGDGDVNAADLSQWQTQAGVAGYYSSDFDFNGQTDNADKNEGWILNEDKSSQVPE